MEQVFSLTDETAPIAGGGTGIGLAGTIQLNGDATAGVVATPSSPRVAATRRRRYARSQPNRSDSGIARCMVAAGARVGLVGRRDSELSTGSVELGRMGQPEDVGWAAGGF